MHGKKIVGTVLLAIVGFVLVVETLSVITMTDPSKGPMTSESIIPLIICTIVGLALFFSKSKDQKLQKRLQKLQNNKLKSQEILKRGLSVNVTHVTGLPLAQGTACTIDCNINGINISGGGSDFNLSAQKITSFEIYSDVEIQKHYVSSAGGAVAGAIVFGALGALVGGKTKEKTTTSSTNYIVINFLKDNELANISFEIPSYANGDAEKMRKHFNNVFDNKERVQVEL